MSIIFTYIARVKDGLVLVASIDQAGSGGDTEQLKQQAKSILKTLDARSPSKMGIDTTHHTFNYVIDEGICYLSLFTKPCPNRLAFAYLEEVKDNFLVELHKEFGDNWRSEVDRIGRPYAFIKFDKAIQKSRRAFADTESRETRSKLKEDITEVQSIMRKNINEVLDRGGKLDHVSTLSKNLHDNSKKWHWGAKKLNLMEWWKKYMPVVFVVFFVLFLAYYFVL